MAQGRRQAIIWISAGILLIGPFGRNIFSQENALENGVRRLAAILSGLISMS